MKYFNLGLCLFLLCACLFQQYQLNHLKDKLELGAMALKSIEHKQGELGTEGFLQLTRLNLKIQKLEGQSKVHTAVFNQLAEFTAKLAKELDLLEKSAFLDYWDFKDKVRLLAGINNNNLIALTKELYEDIVYLDRDWQINQMPKWLDFEEGDEEFFRRFLNENHLCPGESD